MYYMSMRTFYVRKENEDFFDNLPNKSETLNAILVKLQEKSSVPIQMAYDPVKKEILGKPIAPILETTPFVPRPPDPETGYPCCQKTKPCKHWEFDGMNSQWVNSSTGKIREIV